MSLATSSTILYYRSSKNEAGPDVIIYYIVYGRLSRTYDIILYFIYINWNKYSVYNKRLVTVSLTLYLSLYRTVFGGGGGREEREGKKK